MINSAIQVFADVAGSTCEKGNFLGLVPWYQYLTLENDCSIKKFNVLGSNSDIPLVLLAVVDDLLRIAGLVAVVFVIYGGIMYATSQGSPDQTSKAQSTIINALVGLVIAVIAVVFVGFIGRQFR